MVRANYEQAWESCIFSPEFCSRSFRHNHWLYLCLETRCLKPWSCLSIFSCFCEDNIQTGFTPAKHAMNDLYYKIIRELFFLAGNWLEFPFSRKQPCAEKIHFELILNMLDGAINIFQMICSVIKTNDFFKALSLILDNGHVFNCSSLWGCT